MYLELYLLLACIPLVMLHQFVEIGLASRQYSLVELMGSRDHLAPQDIVLQRAKRATRNLLENLVMFVPVVLVAVHLGISNSATQYGAIVFVASRVAYAFIYWAGIPNIRTLAWLGGLIGIDMILWGIFTG